MQQTQPTLTEIMSILRVHRPELYQRYDIKSLGIFGSYVHNKQRKRSDLDILVEFGRAPTFFQFIQLEDQLSHMVGVKVDLVMKSALKPKIGERILAEVILL